MNGTIKAIAGCGLTLLLLGGFVTYLETRLPGETKRQCADEYALLNEGLSEVGALDKQVKAQVKAHPQVLGEVAKSENWGGLLKAADEKLMQLELRYVQEVQPLLAKNSRDDEEQVLATMDEIFKAREAALKSVAHLGPRVKELADILPRAAKRYGALGAALSKAEEQVRGIQTAVAAIEKQTPEAKPIVAREKWSGLLERYAGNFKTLSTSHGALKASLDKHSLESAKEVLKASQALDTQRSRTLVACERIGIQVQALKTFLANHDKYAKNVQADLEALRALPVAELSKLAGEAATRYAFNESEIKRRGAAFATLQANSIKAGERALAGLGRPISEADPAAILKDVAFVHKRRSAGPGVVAALRKQLGELDLSYEKVLVDMEIREGATVTFHQEFAEVTAKRGDPKVLNKRTWSAVKEADYKRLEPWLGMTIAQKPYGYFANQGQRMPSSPAGMGYVGNPSYGRWVEDKWVFNEDPQTKALVACAWGTHYPGHTRQDWTTYSRRKASWKGRDRWGHDAYGSRGSLVALVYANSRYVRHKAYANTRYKKSGGRYRGTRYEQTRSTTVFVGGSRNSGSSRSYRRTSYGK